MGGMTGDGWVADAVLCAGRGGKGGGGGRLGLRFAPGRALKSRPSSVSKRSPQRGASLAAEQTPSPRLLGFDSEAKSKALALRPKWGALYQARLGPDRA